MDTTSKNISKNFKFPKIRNKFYISADGFNQADGFSNDGNRFNNTDGDSTKVKDELVSGGIKTLTNILSPEGLAAEVRAVCGWRNPFISDTKFDECAAKVAANHAPAPQNTPPPASSGMSTGAILGIVGGSLVLLLGGGYLLLRKKK